jgi:hypothetical protein
MHSLSRRFWCQNYTQVLDLPFCARLNAALAQGISEGDPQKAASAADQLIEYIEDFTRAKLAVEGRSPQPSA